MTDAPAILALRRRANLRRAAYLLAELGQVSPRMLRLAYASLTAEQRAALDSLLEMFTKGKERRDGTD